MRRILSIILILFVCLSVSAAVWYQNTTEDALNVFNLEDVYYLPMRSSTWGSNSPSAGTINSTNYLGQVGVSGTNHNIKYTITTSGKFVSQSDPTKYREFCVAMCPRYNNNITDYGFFWDVETNSAINSNDRAPNTKNTGTASVTSPKTDNSNVSVASGQKRRIKSFWIDLVICMDALNNDDLKHISANDDYIAEIYITWSCKSSGCADSTHNGSYTFILRGYFGESDADQDAVYMFVIPSASSSNMNIRNVIRNGEERIADIQIHTNTRTDTSRGYINYGSCPGYEWKDHVFAFISASSDFSTSEDGFYLVKRGNSSIKIPYTIKVHNSDGSVNKIYDGRNSYTGSTAAQRRVYSIDLGEYRVSTDRYGNKYNTIDFYGYVSIVINDAGGVISTNQDGVYSGVYDSLIYYHIIYE